MWDTWKDILQRIFSPAICARRDIMCSIPWVGIALGYLRKNMPCALEHTPPSLLRTTLTPTVVSFKPLVLVMIGIANLPQVTLLIINGPNGSLQNCTRKDWPMK